ncbi:hypothetical protein RPSD_34630 (plasmid) [Ralstonia solanacearum]|nr:hypothetical protein RPSD_34630 [Ralstonia solanacearum]
MALARTVLVAAALGGASLANAESLLVPAYIYPSGSGGDAWTTLATTAQKVATTVILNPSSGPGSAQDANYVAAIAQIHAAGGKVIGYVSSAYATRSLSAVVQDISTYLSFYSVDGFFIDEMTSDSDTTHIQYYQSVYNYIKGLSSAYAVTGNPGTGIPDQGAVERVRGDGQPGHRHPRAVCEPACGGSVRRVREQRRAIRQLCAASMAGELPDEPVRPYRVWRGLRGADAVDCPGRVGPGGRQCVRHAQELAGPVLGIAQILEPGNRGRRRELTLGPAGRSERAGRDVSGLNRPRGLAGPAAERAKPVRGSCHAAADDTVTAVPDTARNAGWA